MSGLPDAQIILSCESFSCYQQSIGEIDQCTQCKDLPFRVDRFFNEMNLSKIALLVTEIFVKHNPKIIMNRCMSEFCHT